MIPLMAQQDYSAKGWLGLILGTRLWYPMWDAEKDDDAAFEKRLDNVVREIGDRGQKPQQQQQAYQTTQQIQMSASAESAAGAAPNGAPELLPALQERQHWSRRQRSLSRRRHHHQRLRSVYAVQAAAAGEALRSSHRVYTTHPYTHHSSRSRQMREQQRQQAITGLVSQATSVKMIMLI